MTTKKIDKNYYAEGLNSQNLYDVYETKHERIKQYLNAEIDFVKKDLKGTENVLELGAGYGRIMKMLAPFCNRITDIDISKDNVDFGAKYLASENNAELIVMDAHNLKLDNQFDVILCLQNGLSAMKIEPFSYVKRLTNMLNENGKLYISTYSPRFWEERLIWFYEQADKGLLGEIDKDKTKDGVIICKDGFIATTHSEEELNTIGRQSGFPYIITEVDESSLFLIIRK